MRGLRPEGFLEILLMVLGMVLLLSWQAQGAPGCLEIRPARIEIGSFFQGAALQVSAIIPATVEAVLEVQGPIRDEHLARKGRRWGVWMNTGELTIRGVPSLYFCRATNPALVLQATAPWGYEAWRRECRVEEAGQSGDEEMIFQQLLQLKETEGVYGVSSVPLEVKSEPTGGKEISTVFHLPAQVSPGLYRVRLYLLAGDGQISKEERELHIVKVGMPRWVSSLAFRQPLLYGVAAVIIALVAGFAIGLIFKGKGSH